METCFLFICNDSFCFDTHHLFAFDFILFTIIRGWHFCVFVHLDVCMCGGLQCIYVGVWKNVNMNAKLIQCMNAKKKVVFFFHSLSLFCSHIFFVILNVFFSLSLCFECHPLVRFFRGKAVLWQYLLVNEKHTGISVRLSFMCLVLFAFFLSVNNFQFGDVL